MSRIVVAGAAGRMGRQLLRAVGERDDVQLSGAFERPDADSIGVDVGVLTGEPACGIVVSDSVSAVAEPFDSIIDFTSPASTVSLLEYAADTKTAMVIGTTGLTEDDKLLMKKIAGETAVVYASNYSVGVTLSLELLAHAATVLGEHYDIEIIESHHKHKVDAPSGTALSMGEAIADAMGLDLKNSAVMSREGITGERKPNTIGFSAVRAGDIIGEHTALFCGQGERLEITHKATDRMTFARGAVRAAAWVSQQPAGLYNMKDVLSVA